MTNPSNYSDSSPLTDKKRKLEVLRMKLRSPKPGDVLLGMNEVTQWLREAPEDWDVYGMLLNIVSEAPELREQVRGILIEMMNRGAEAAGKALSGIPSSVQDLLADADDAYYAAEYEKSIQLYRQVLRLNAKNAKAKEYLAKAKELLKNGEPVSGLPRDAVQYYRQARSYIAARDYSTAMKMLEAAIESAQARGQEYPEADQLLNSVQDLIIADEFKQKANLALENGELSEALNLYDKALALEPTDKVIKKEFDSLHSLLHAEVDLRKRGHWKIVARLGPVQKALGVAKGVINPDDPLLNLIEKQVKQILVIRWGIFLIAALLTVAITYIFWNNRFTVTIVTPTLASATITNNIYTNIPTSTIAAPISTITPTATITILPSVTPTETPTIVTLGQGYIVKALITAQDKPNGKKVEQLGLNQIVTILEKIYISGSTWYRCSWVKDGVAGEGWILEQYIQFGPPPE